MKTLYRGYNESTTFVSVLNGNSISAMLNISIFAIYDVLKAIYFSAHCHVS